MDKLFKCHGPCGKDLPQEAFKPVANKRGVSKHCIECSRQNQVDRVRIGRRKSKISQLANAIGNGGIAAETPRALNQILKLIVEDQLRKYARLICHTPVSMSKASQSIDDMMRGMTLLLSRVTDTIYRASKDAGYTDPIVINDLLEAYSVLGLFYGADFEEIRSAYRKKAREFHPDRNGNSDMMAKINKAFELLTKGHNDGEGKNNGRAEANESDQGQEEGAQD